MRTLIFHHHPAWMPGLIASEGESAGWAPQHLHLADGDMPPRDLTGVKALIVLGGPFLASQQDEYPWMRQELKLIAEAHAENIPVLGVGFGAHLLAIALGGASRPLVHDGQLWLESGWSRLHFDERGLETGLFRSFPRDIDAFTFHRDEIVPPRDAAVLARSGVCPVQVFQVGDRWLGVQPHLEIRKEGITGVIEDQMELIEQAGVSPVHMQMDMLLRLQQVELYASMLFSRFFDLAANDS